MKVIRNSAHFYSKLSLGKSMGTTNSHNDAGDRPLASEKPLKSCKLRNLICVPLTTSSSADGKLLVSLFNARSVGTAEKRTEICNFVQDQNIDILFLTDLAYSQG